MGRTGSISLMEHPAHCVRGGRLHVRHHTDVWEPFACSQQATQGYWSSVTDVKSQAVQPAYNPVIGIISLIPADNDAYW
jgi:hypothetical protein